MQTCWPAEIVQESIAQAAFKLHPDMVGSASAMQPAFIKCLLPPPELQLASAR